MKISFTDYSSWTFWRLLTLLIVLTAGGASAQISGTVFRDFNANGTYEAIPASGTYTYGEATVAGITVTAYNAANAVVATTTTNNAGAYTLTTASGIANGTAYRIEFTGVATGDFTGPQGTGNGSSVQFVTASATAVNFGINYPTDYCQDNPPVATACYVFGNQTGGNAADPVFITFPFNAGSRAVLINEGVTPATGAYDQPTAHPIMTAASQVGTTFGIAYARGTRTFYAASYFKKHAGFGPGGPGAIYLINGTTGAVSTSFAVPNATINSHDPANYQIDNGNVAWDAVGKTSLGGMDLSDDEQTLYVMNLENRNLYALNATTGARIANQPMTAVAGCPVGDVRPFAVEFRRGTLYVGIVCTAESSSLVTANLQGYVYTVNPTTLALSASPVFQFPLTYPRGKAASTGPANWLPWRPFYTNISNSANTPATSPRIVYPMPMLTNLDFDVNNDLIIGLRDRLGDITGHNTFDNPNNIALTTQGRIAGDILRAGSTGVNSWTLESNGRVGGRGTSRQGTPTSQGPGGAEFYQGDSYPLSSSVTGTVPYSITSVSPAYNYTITTGVSTVGPGQITLANGIQGFGENHDETSLGTVLQLPGQGEVMALVYDPVPDNNDDGFFDGGVRRMSNVTGSWTQSYRIYKGEAASTNDFGKAAGLSEPVAQCNPTPIEIGNRVWNDVDNDGIQDANETSYAAVSGLTVQLLQGGTVISTTTVSATGTYLFSSVSTTAIQPNTAYQIRLVLPDNTRAISSTPTAGTNRSVDSDASPAGVISLTTGNYGENNHTYDIGVLACTLPTGTISATAATCLNNAPTANGRVAVTGITNGAQANVSQGTSYTGVGFNGAGNVAVAGGAVSFTGLTGGRTYTVRVFSGTATCAQDFTIAVPQTNCCALAFADVVAGPCSTTTNQFTTTGRVTLGGAVAGNLVITNGAQTVTVPVTSATTSVTFALVDESDGTTQTISASLAGCGSTTTTMVNPVACFTVCPSSCSLVSTIRYATTAEANAEFSYQTLGAEARFGDDNSSTTSAYELDFNRVSPAFATLTTGQYNWASGTVNSFTLVYNPALPGSDRAVFILAAGAQRVSIQTNPQTPATGTPLPVQFNAIQLSLQANDLITASAQVSNLALNGSLLGANLSAASVLTLRDSDDIIIRSSQRGQAFVLTGTLTFNWVALTPPSENGLSLNIRLGTVNDCAASPITTVNSATIACQATSTTLTANSNQTGLTYQWTGPGSFTANTQSVTVTAPGTYTVVSTNPDTGCASTTTTATVTRAPSVTVTVSASPSNTVCQGNSVTLTANASGGTGFTYAWSPAGTGSTQSVTVTPAVTTIYTVTVTNSNLCSTTASATVTVNPAVTAVITASPGSTICQGASVTLTASGGNAYRWSTGATSATIIVAPVSTTAFSVTVANASNCSAIASATVTVNAAVTATVNSATLTCQAPVATLTATSSQTGLTYRWSGPAGFTATTQSVTVVNPGTYTVVTTNAQTGCSSGTTATVSQVAGVAITIFTQSSCLNNGTDATATDDYFTVTIQATNGTPGVAGRYEVVLGADANGLGGTVLNPSGTPYGTSVTVGGVGQPNARGFLANGSSIYSLTVRDTNNTTANSGCRSTRLTGQVSPCSACLPALCQPAQLRRL